MSLDRTHQATQRRHAVDHLPVVDVAALVDPSSSLAQRQAVADRIRQVCIDIGFFYIANHAIPRQELDDFLATGQRLFELPLAEKLRVDARNNVTRQGFIQVGGVAPGNTGGPPPDIKERFSFSRERQAGEPTEGSFDAGTAQWPDDAVLPGFRATMQAHIARRVALAQRLVRGFALSLGLAEDHFDSMYRRPGAIMLMNHYPSMTGEQVRQSQWSFSPHTDYGMFTVLLQNHVGGLQARNSAGDWIDVPPIPGTFVINIGDLFARWTNDLYASSLHRARNHSGVARLSSALFTYPHGRTEIRTLPTCINADAPQRYEPVVAEDYNRALVEHNHRTGRPGISDRTAERLAPERL